MKRAKTQDQFSGAEERGEGARRNEARRSGGRKPFEAPELRRESDLVDGTGSQYNFS